MTNKTAEFIRLDEDKRGQKNWRRWGPYVSDRSWGTVREDYSWDGNAWGHLTHDQARSKAYRWGEDALAGICDRYQLLVFAPVMWNERDPILKERLFGLVPTEANHGEDVKEYYFYLDATPTASYLKFLYKYPQAEFPYAKLVAENSRRSRDEPEYELLDTGVFDDNRYFDVFVEYAKLDEEDLCIRIEVCNRGTESAPIRMLPHLWFRNTWGWTVPPTNQPVIRLIDGPTGTTALEADSSNADPLDNLLHPYVLGKRYLYADRSAKALLTNNETNTQRLYNWPQPPDTASEAQPETFGSPYAKDAFHRYLIDGEPNCINPRQVGTKACFDYGTQIVPANDSIVFRLRLSNQPLTSALDQVDQTIELRRQEADAFYHSVHPPKATADERLVQRQAFAGLIWSKQIYLFDVKKWIEGDNPDCPPPPARRNRRNRHWEHLNSMRIMSMPDKWEYPWFAAWDLAFHCLPFALIDPEFAKEQLWLLLFEQFQHPNGQIPAYEWEFSDLNPPVHAWAVWRVYNIDADHHGVADRNFLETCFHKLLLNFTWWINKVDSEGHNLFEGGFLGLDNVATFDRSDRLQNGAVLKQADATGWMGMYCLNMMQIALELAKQNSVYVGLATKFFEHYVYIGSAMKNMGGRQFQLWSDEDGLFGDVLCYPDGSYHRFGLRSLVSLIPLYAVEHLDVDAIREFTEFDDNVGWFIRNRKQMSQACVCEHVCEHGKVHLLSLLNDSQLRKILRIVWSPSEFRSQFGLRSLSKYHQDHPYVFNGQQVRYESSEATTWLKGGNSNWRGPVWFPTTYLMIESLQKLSQVYGDQLQIANDDGSSTRLDEMAATMANGLISLFLRDSTGNRPIFGEATKFQLDPHWRDCLLFHEYFNPETGKGLGASHQTGWTALVASLIDQWRR